MLCIGFFQIFFFLLGGGVVVRGRMVVEFTITYAISAHQHPLMARCTRYNIML
jgi:hypothetical protein